MTKYVAFLRAINVGGHNVKMDALRALFDEMGMAGSQTLLASGNVIFESASSDTKALERRIEARLQQALGYEVVTFLRSIEDLARILEEQPFPEADVNAKDNVLYVGFLADPPTELAIENVLALATRAHAFSVQGREVFWFRRRNLDTSDYSGAHLEKALGLPTTVRNVNTVRRIVAKYG